MYPLGVTHTGHPGPDRNASDDGIAAARPCRCMAIVWVPHTSMIAVGRPIDETVDSISLRIALIRVWDVITDDRILVGKGFFDVVE